MIKIQQFGKLSDGQVASIYTIVNKNGNRLSITNYGGRVVSFLIKDKIGDFHDLLLGYDDLNGYIEDKHLLGANICYNLVTNIDDIKNSDSVFFDKSLWDVVTAGQEGEESIVLSNSYLIDEQNKLDISVTYSLSEDDQIIIKEWAHSSCDVCCDFVQSLFFNLNSQTSIEAHTAVVNADMCSATNKGFSAEEFEQVKGRVNLNKPKSFKNLSAAKHSLIKNADGLDLYYLLRNDGVKADEKDRDLYYVGRVRGRTLGIKMEVYTTKPGLYLYTANRFDGLLGKKQATIESNFVQPLNDFDNVNSRKNSIYDKHSGFCISPTTHRNIVKSNEQYKNCTVYKFVTR
ncbi:MAG: hypothetical protein LBU60_00040 [Clostridiales bacterium]|jgi:aldose 1-epimerase|nr:hypothetical protein [Clostridiales bacterium]